MNRENLKSRFLQEFEKLNEQQKRAVNHIEGPVMVIAGPGTGKTQILATRIGKILLETDVMPENILCLTYTEAGVIAMRKRLLQFIGPDAYKVGIYTFHAFCNEVIQENLSLFEKNSLDLISDLEKTALFKTLIDRFPEGHILKRYRGDVYFEINSLETLFSTMKREGFTPELISRKIDEYLADLPNRKDFIYQKKTGEHKAGDLKVNKLEDEKEKMEKLRAAVMEFKNFQELMRTRNRYDFDDMINWVISAFEQNRNLLARYQEQFLYLLVDEFQDTSGTQNRLVSLLINYWDKPNVFVVGDDDQSIYRFQGANVENMTDFAQRYEDELVKVVLTDNYRSSQPILDMSKSFIDRNEERLVKQVQGLNKELIAAHPHKKNLTHQPQIREYETQRQEMIGITLEVLKLLSQEVSPGRIGIIYKEHKFGEELAEFLQLKEVPVFSKRSLNILDLPLIRKLVTIFRYLASEHDIPYGGDEMLFEILHFDWFGIPPMEIAKLTSEVADLKFTDQKTSLRKILYDRSTQPSRDLFTSHLHERLKEAAGLIEKWISHVPNLTLQQLVETVIREGGILQQVMNSHDKHWNLQVLTAFFDFVKDETRRNARLGLQELVNIFDLMESENIPLELVRVSGSEKGVNLMTAHGSKGLEFEYVFLVGCIADLWEKKKPPRQSFRFPDTILTTSTASNSNEELRRLFYVALTRAEQHLILSYSRFNNDGKEREPSVFIAELQESNHLPVEKVYISEEMISAFQQLHFIESTAPEIEQAEEEWIGRLLEKFVMNVTALNNYLKCPLNFYFNNLVRIPSPKNENTEFGSAVHFALEQLFKGMQESDTQTFPSKEDFIRQFEWYMNRHRESFTREQFNRRLEYGYTILGNYYDQNISRFNKIVAIERNIRNVVVEGVPLKGKLDKLEFEGNAVNVVDYKTGDPEKAKAKLKGPSDKEPDGGDYWRQAVFYKLLVDHYPSKNWRVVSTEFDFVEPNRKKEYERSKIIIKPEDLEIVKDQIKTVWQKIQNREFYIGCGKEECHWCSFVKTNQLQVALHNLTEAGEETE